MLQVLLVVARAIALGADRWRARAASRRPMLVEISVLRERLDAALEQNALLRARLDRVPHRRRPQYRRHERLAILYHAARFAMRSRSSATGLPTPRVPRCVRATLELLQLHARLELDPHLELRAVTFVGDGSTRAPTPRSFGDRPLR